MTEIVRSLIGVATYLAPDGPLNNSAAVAALREGIDACLASAQIHIVLDFVNVPLVNGALLEVLLDAHDQLTRVGGELKVANANTLIRDIFYLTGVEDYVVVLQPGLDEVRGTPTQVQFGAAKRLGELLVAHGLVTEETIAEAVELQAKTGQRLGHVLVAKGWVTEKDFLSVLSEQLSLPFVQLRTGLYDTEAVRLINLETAKRLRVLPLFKLRSFLFLASSDPQAMASFDAVEELTGLKVKPVLAGTEDVLTTIREAHSADHSLSEYLGELDLENDLELVEQQNLDDYTANDEMAGESPIINLVNGLIQRAVRDGASDIHIEPLRTKCRIRFRIDGVLYQVMNPPIDVHPAVVSRLKVMANLAIAERRLPQDGRIQVYTNGRTIDMRFSSLPGIFGEKVVLRVLDKGQAIMIVDKLGMTLDNLNRFKALLQRSYGLILVTGPTGSGKTTTLYAAINHLSSVEKSIVTIEDPVEYQLDSINQNQVKDDIGLSFAKVLKHVLRQDPDIVMVGEIRERDTAEIAVQAALTGHLVLSTLHTNDGPGAITRMLDMGIEPYLLSSALIGVIAQRLVRTVCPDCKTSYVAPPGSLARYGIREGETVRLTRGRGCPACYDSGYRGRIAIHELVEIDSDTQNIMLSNPTRDMLSAHVSERGIKTLGDAGIDQALTGVTTIEEVNRVVNI